MNTTFEPKYTYSKSDMVLFAERFVAREHDAGSKKFDSVEREAYFRDLGLLYAFIHEVFSGESP